MGAAALRNLPSDERRAMGTLLRAEVEGLRAARRAVARVVGEATLSVPHGAIRTPLERAHVMETIRQSAERMRASVRDTIVAVRQGARASGLVDLEATIGPLSPAVRELGLAAGTEDLLRADAVAQSFASAWAQKALAETQMAAQDAARGGARTALGALQRSVQTTDARLRRILATETNDAFSGGRMAASAAAARGREGLALRKRFVQVWIATLDNTCAECMREHRRERPLGAMFRSTIPVHPNCHCVIVVRERSE